LVKCAPSKVFEKLKELSNLIFASSAFAHLSLQIDEIIICCYLREIREFEAVLLLPLNSRSFTSPYGAMVYKGHFEVCNYFVTLA